MHTKDLYATGQLCSSDLFSAMLGPAMLVSMTAQNTGTKGFFWKLCFSTAAGIVVKVVVMLAYPVSVIKHWNIIGSMFFTH